MKEAGTKRKQQAQQTRKRIYTAALRLFNEKGFENVSVEMIAEEAQTSVGSIYHYFSGKDNIPAQMLYMLDEEYEEFFAKLTKDEPYRHLSPLEKIAEYFIYAHQCSADASVLNYAYIHGLRNENSDVLKIRKDRALYRNYSELLQQCKETGQLPSNTSSEAVIEILVQAGRGLLVDWMLRGKDFDIAAQGRRLIQAVLAGLRQNPPLEPDTEKADSPILSP